MIRPKMQPCPDCNSTDHLSVYEYDSGTKHVECDNGRCMYLGPGSGSIVGAIKLHNERITEAGRAALKETGK